ncbi:MAG: helix-turn-helix transcriptional regulator [Lachnospiraceae bacterium]|nr:helix-turn-helix transcriptional regulator [Candidatus Colinaster scatohippi]
MDVSKEWYRSEFIQQELMDAHRDMESELPFYAAIAEGNVEYVEKNCLEKAFVNPEGMGKLSENPIQNIRYHFVVTTALIVRYCVHAGMEQEKAYGLSDFYILKMDSLNTIDEISALHDVMCLDICRQMQVIRNTNILSKQVVLCLDYIYSHIHYRITIAELADELNISESYLSKLFKKEMGVSVSEYILSLKIEKAKNLLQYSDYKLIDIANYLAFSSQSHFIQSFQKATGYTPHKYRTQFFRTNWKNFSEMGKNKID